MFNRPLIPALISLLGGIYSAHLVPGSHLSLILIISLIIPLLLVITIYSSRSTLRSPGFLSLFFLLGMINTLDRGSDSRLSHLAENREEVIIEGTVLEPSRTIKGIIGFQLQAHRIFLRNEAEAVREKIRVTVFKDSVSYRPGEKIRFPARLGAFRNFNNPGHYDYKRAMKFGGVSCAAMVSDGRYIVHMGHGDAGLLIDYLEWIRRPIRHLFHENLPPDKGAMLLAFVLGERQGISTELEERFYATGLGHALAVSGQNLGLVALLAYFFIKGLLSFSYRISLRVDIRKVAALLTCLPVIVYACLTGLQVSIQRAMIMALAYLLSIILSRERDVWSPLALAAIIVLALDPHAIYSISFQLSFAAVIAILWLAPSLLHKMLSPFRHEKEHHPLFHLYSYLSGLMAVTLSSLIILAPIISYHFHRIPLVSPFANVTVIPLIGLWVLPIGLVSAISLPLCPSLAELFLRLASWGLEVMIRLIRFWAQFSWADCWVVTPNIFEICLYFGLILSIFYFRRSAWSKLAFLSVSIILFIDVLYWTYDTRYHPHLRVTYLDVGQGNAALIQFPGKKRMLIDGGGLSSDRFDVGQMVVAPFLWHSKIGRLDYLVLSHPQSDHMNGLRFIASAFSPKEFWYNGDAVDTPSFIELMTILETEGIKRLTPPELVGGREISGAKIQVLHPGHDVLPEKPGQRGMPLNDHSLVLKLTYEGKTFLFPGDVERHGEEFLISHAGASLKSDILLAPHHGSKTSCSEPFLNLVKPKICVISSGKGDDSLFPHRDVLHRLNRIGCSIIRTDQLGSVHVSVGLRHFQVSTFKNNL